MLYKSRMNWGVVERMKMAKHQNGSQGGFKPGPSRLRVRHSTTELPHSTYGIAALCSPLTGLKHSFKVKHVNN